MARLAAACAIVVLAFSATGCGLVPLHPSPVVPAAANPSPPPPGGGWGSGAAPAWPETAPPLPEESSLHQRWAVLRIGVVVLLAMIGAAGAGALGRPGV